MLRRCLAAARGHFISTNSHACSYHEVRSKCAGHRLREPRLLIERDALALSYDKL